MRIQKYKHRSPKYNRLQLTSNQTETEELFWDTRYDIVDSFSSLWAIKDNV